MCLIVYGATCIGSAFVALTSPVCTQYDMAYVIPAAPLVMLAGLFVIFALTVAGFREGAVTAAISGFLSLGIFGALWLSLRATWRGLGSGPIVAPGMVVLAAILVLLNAATTFAFCLSMSV